MILRNRVRLGWLPALLAYAFLSASAMAQNYSGQNGQPNPNYYNGYRTGVQPQPPQRAVYPHNQPRVAEHTATVQNRPGPIAAAPVVAAPQQPREHPLMPALRWAHGGLGDVERIQDYSATMVKRERINGKLGEPEYIFVKIRHKPLSAYMYFLDPANLRGQEALYVEGQNNGKMSAHGTGFKKVFGTVSLDPTGIIAMQGNRYPITEVGILNLVRRLIEIGERDAQYGECEVNFFPGAKINGRSCTCIQIMHPVPRRNFLFHLSRIFIDDELNLPIRYESHDWPSQPGGKPELIEEYTYLNLKINNGFTDADFDINNPNYQFKPQAKN